MNLNDYFDSINLDNTEREYLSSNHQLIKNVKLNDNPQSIKNIDDYDIAIIGVVASDDKTGLKNGLLQIRNSLYGLSEFEKSPKIIDLGNLKEGKTSKDTIIGLRDVIVELITSNVLPIIIGSSEIVLYANYLAYKLLGDKINLTLLDSKINISSKEQQAYKSALWKILVEENDSLFSFANLGYQSHFVSPNIVKYLSDQLHFSYRLGYIKANMKDAEPILRDTHLFGLNISALRQSEALGQFYSSPNGFYGDEICQLARYGGISDKISSFGIYDYYPSHDFNNQTANLIAQIIWYFMSGFIHRRVEHPANEKEEFKRFIVNLDTFEYEIIFYKSENSERWWMEVPSFKNNSKKNLLIACTYNDYSKACNGDVPERWLKAFQKIN